MKSVIKAIIFLVMAFTVIFYGGALLLPGEARVERSITISAPPDKIYAIVADLRRVPEWSPWVENDPQTKHVTELKTANSTRRPGFEFIVDGKSYRWNELQLPVYYHNLRKAYGEHIKDDHKIEVGYIILPSEGPAEALIWHDYAEKFSQHGEDAIKNAVARLLSEDPAIFAPKQTGTKYPTLEHLQGRKPDAYMLTELLGKVETKPTTK